MIANLLTKSMILKDFCQKDIKNCQVVNKINDFHGWFVKWVLLCVHRHIFQHKFFSIDFNSYWNCCFAHFCRFDNVTINGFCPEGFQTYRSNHKRRVTLPNLMNFRKSSKGEWGHFQSKNLYCKLWTFIKGLFRTFSGRRPFGIFPKIHPIR